jgi:hypothetical protein
VIPPAPTSRGRRGGEEGYRTSLSDPEVRQSSRRPGSRGGPRWRSSRASTTPSSSCSTARCFRGKRCHSDHTNRPAIELVPSWSPTSRNQRTTATGSRSTLGLSKPTGPLWARS